MTIDWRRKNARYLDDPPNRHVELFGDESGETYASSLARGSTPAAKTSEPPSARDPGHWTASADRPYLGTPDMLSVDWWDEPLVTHPLDRAPLRLGLPEALGSSLVSSHVSRHASTLVDHAVAATRQEDRAAACFYALWRRLEDELAANPPEGVEAAAWRRYVRLCPADPRSPDHTVRDQARLASALTFSDVERAGAGEGPWLFRFTVGPVKAWIRATRTSRDLWTASFLLSEISFAAMLVVVDRFGPDAIVYPDLAFNDRMDRYLARTHPEALVDRARDARTRAALIPNAWLALVPDPRALGEACREAAEKRWRELAVEVRDQFVYAMREVLADEERSAAHDRWTTQIEGSSDVQVHAAAIQWQTAVDIEEEPPVPRSLPAMDDAGRQPAPYRERFTPFVESSDLDRYERVVWVFGRTRRAAGLEQPRTSGWDYAPTWHLLHRALEARKLSRRFATPTGAATTTCSVCGHRDALGAPASGNVDERRAATTAFWGKVAEVVRSDAEGAERLCGICATRRFLVPPWKTEPLDDQRDDAWTDTHLVWARNEDDFDANQKRLRFPMPSTAAVAAGPWLAEVNRRDELQPARDQVLASSGAVRWPHTFFARSLPLVARHADPDDLFNRLEPSMLFDGPREAELDTAEAELDSAQKGIRTPARRAFAQAVRGLRRSARELDLGLPSSRFAVLAVDGDHLGGLLIGASDRVAEWREVLHPAVVERLGHDDLSSEAWVAGWREILRGKRLMGPSLHAFVNRAGTTFANRLVPWVVEREFGGRLVYAGGDDVLALAPASHALGIAARLQQLWSAPWILDTQPDETAWTLRPREDLETARLRFRVLAAHEGPIDPDVPRFEPHASTGEVPPPTTDGRLLPMLGRHQSVSAGIAYAHFKTPLGLVVDEAKRALEEDAKYRAGRAACAEVLYTRGGPKYRSVFGWNSGREMPMVRVVEGLRAEFRAGRLPGRLPYKLADAASGLRLLRGHSGLLQRWIGGSVRRALESEDSEALLPRLVDLWMEGIRASREPDGPRDVSTRLAMAPAPHDVPGLGNLLLCRALAREDDE